MSTADEPWILLPMVYALRKSGVYAEYGARSAQLSIDALVSSLPRGKKDYWAAVRLMCDKIYTDLASPEARYFVDKTPRYHLILPELREIYSDALFVMVVRNPLSIMASIIEHNGGKISGLVYGQIDVVQGIRNMAAAMSMFEGQLHLIRYESLVTDPKNEIEALMRFLDLDHNSLSEEVFLQRSFSRGDRNGATYKSVSTGSLQKWQTTLATPARLLLVRALLSRIDEKSLSVIGFDKHACGRQLATLKPSFDFQGLVECLELAFAFLRMKIQNIIVRNRRRTFLY